jgi:protein-disulfide isomerase
MKRTLLTLATLLVCAGAQAQMSSAAAIRTYAGKTMPRCPGGTLTVEPASGAGPANFNVYTATLRSTDQYCGAKKYVLHSPKTHQVLVGSVIPIPKNGQPANVRIAAEASKLLGKQMMANVAPFPLPDGLKAVSIIRQTPYGPFSYSGYLDASEEYLIVAQRGNLNTEPAHSLRELLNVSKTAVRRGNGAAKVEILELSDFQCPTCAMAHEKIEPIIQKNLGKVSYGRIDLPLFEHHEWAVPAAMGARAIQRVDSTKYWAYVDYVFKHQEEIGKQNFDKFIQEYCKDHDIDWAAVQKIYASKSERQALLEQVSRAFAAGIASTPTFIVNGQVMGFGPEGTFTIESIKSALGIASAPAKSGSK